MVIAESGGSGKLARLDSMSRVWCGVCRIKDDVERVRAWAARCAGADWTSIDWCGEV